MYCYIEETSLGMTSLNFILFHVKGFCKLALFWSSNITNNKLTETPDIIIKYTWKMLQNSFIDGALRILMEI